MRAVAAATFSSAAPRIGNAAQHMAYGGIGEYAAAAAGDAHAVQVITNGVGAHALVEVFIEIPFVDKGIHGFRGLCTP